MSGDQIPSLPGRKRRQMSGVCPGGMFKLGFDWFMRGLCVFLIFLGQRNETFNKRRSHCVCPNCISGLNSGSGNIQQKSHSCHYPGCGKVGFGIKKIKFVKEGRSSFHHLNLLSELTENEKMGLLMFYLSVAIARGTMAFKTEGHMDRVKF